jgi:hypothetical protein
VNDRIGLLYDAQNRSISFYRNGKFLGTPFRNVEGALFVCLEACHAGSFSVIDEPDISKELIDEMNEIF